MAKEEAKIDKLEREYIINLRRKVNGVPIYKRTPKAIRTVKEFLVRHMKIRDRDLNKVRLDRYLNEFLWARGIKNPMTRIKVKAIKEGDIVRVELAELPVGLKFKKLREEKREERGAEVAKKKKGEKKTEETKPEEKTEEKIEEEKEKKAATVEAGMEMEKSARKMAKHEAKGTKNQPKRQQRMALQK
ncbi:hypothetical protein A3K62_01470 [Candidatus Pacearchaeota archaeon RBG_16_35_8]|nr:MAG: hypothetical protein A3K62_01470 [Candidatus Pacearchaeota archaeon RBG_16_35_8]